VFLGHPVGHTTALKKKEAERFARNRQMEFFEQNRVEQLIPLRSYGTSNFACVFDRFLKRRI
jgi:hypothetical protein